MQPKVMLVDQDPIFVDALRSKLQAHRIKVLACERQQDGKLPIDKEDIDTVLLDVRYRGEDTIRLLASLKSERPDIEVIILSNTESIRWTMEGMQEGAFDDVVEPFDAEKLIFSIKAAIKKRRSIWYSISDYFETNMMAAAFAHECDFDSAIKLIEESKDKRSQSKKRISSQFSSLEPLPE